MACLRYVVEISHFLNFYPTHESYFCLKWGVPKIHIVSVLASKKGLESIQKAHPDVYVTVGMVDQGLSKDGIVLPGLGDCGDRLFGTAVEYTSGGVSGVDDGSHHGSAAGADGDDQDLVLHPSKRKRSNSIDLDKKLEQVEAEMAAEGGNSD